MGIGPFSEIFRSLTARLLALLTLALMPLGAIAVYQTSELSGQLREREAEALIGSSEVSVLDYSRLYHRAFGAAEALATLTAPLVGAPDECRLEVERLVSLTELVDGAAVIDASGNVICGTLVLDDDASGDLRDLASHGRSFIEIVGGNQSVLGHAVASGSDEAGHFVVLELSEKVLSQTGIHSHDSLSPHRLSIFSSGGTILAGGFHDEGAPLEWPGPNGAETIGARSGSVFHVEDHGGAVQTFTVVPVIGELAYGLAEWNPADVPLLRGQSLVSPWILPLAMWIATLAVAYVAISRLVVRHARILGDRMRSFADGRNLPLTDGDHDQPEMFREMNQTFRSMAEAVVQDEARLEDAVREKTILIREVHHRVKNNLQLIASIMNMMIRKDRGSETSHVIRRLQDRVLGLAAVHRRMYEAESITSIPADELLRDITNQMLLSDPSLAARAETDFVPLTLGPDQSVPLALLAAEATANAAKYASADEGSDPRVEIHLRRIGDEMYEFSVENSLSAEEPEPRESVTNGLGTQLMQGFVTQLDGTLDVTEDDKSYRVAVTFPAKNEDAPDVEKIRL